MSAGVEELAVDAHEAEESYLRYVASHPLPMTLSVFPRRPDYILTLRRVPGASNSLESYDLSI
jgi:hypothetical protein